MTAVDTAVRAYGACCADHHGQVVIQSSLSTEQHSLVLGMPMRN